MTDSTTKTTIIVDSACSLPSSICNKYNVSFVPLTYTVNGETHRDPCSPKKNVELFQSDTLTSKNDVITTPPSPEDFESVINKKIGEGYNRIIVQTVNRTQGDTYNNANLAVSKISKSLPDKSTTVRVMDSRTVFAGQGLMAIETIRRLLKDKNHDEVRRKMDSLSEKIHTYIIPRDIVVARARAASRNENNISWMQAKVASTLGICPVVCNSNDSSYVPKKIRGFNNAAKELFEHACSRILEGLHSPIITLNYVGSLDDLKALPGYDELSDLAAEKKITLVPSVASIAGGVYSSVGSVSLSLATDPHEWT
ncbi:DegV family protein [Aurantivibrio infirmus]